MLELVDSLDLKSSERKLVWVRVPPWAHLQPPSLKRLGGFGFVRGRWDSNAGGGRGTCGFPVAEILKPRGCKESAGRREIPTPGTNIKTPALVDVFIFLL